MGNSRACHARAHATRLDRRHVPGARRAAYTRQCGLQVGPLDITARERIANLFAKRCHACFGRAAVVRNQRSRHAVRELVGEVHGKVLIDDRLRATNRRSCRACRGAGATGQHDNQQPDPGRLLHPAHRRRTVPASRTPTSRWPAGVAQARLTQAQCALQEGGK